MKPVCFRLRLSNSPSNETQALQVDPTLSFPPVEFSAQGAEATSAFSTRLSDFPKVRYRILGELKEMKEYFVN